MVVTWSILLSGDIPLKKQKEFIGFSINFHWNFHFLKEKSSSSLFYLKPPTPGTPFYSKFKSSGTPWWNINGEECRVWWDLGWTKGMKPCLRAPYLIHWLLVCGLCGSSIDEFILPRLCLRNHPPHCAAAKNKDPGASLPGFEFLSQRC